LPKSLFQICQQVNGPNCLIKKVLEMGIVASNKKVLEIMKTYLRRVAPRGGRDEANDGTAAGGGGQDSGKIAAEQEEREGTDTGRVYRVDGIQSGLCQTSIAPSWQTIAA
jgi:hypothetical protein